MLFACGGLSCPLLSGFCELVSLGCWLSGNSAWMPGPFGWRTKESGPKVLPPNHVCHSGNRPRAVCGGPSLFAQQNEERSWTVGLVLGPHARCQRSVAVDQNRRPAVINSPADLGVLEKDLYMTQTCAIFVPSPKVLDHKLPVELKLATGRWTLGLFLSVLFLNQNGLVMFGW